MTTLLITRPQKQVGELVQRLGGEVELLFQPTIAIGPPDDGYRGLDAALERPYDWLVFSSVNGVEAWFSRLPEGWRPGETRLAAIGPGTRDALEARGFEVAFVPEVFRAEFLAEGLVSEAKKGRSFLLLRASRGREILAETLSSAGGNVVQAVAYSSVDVFPDSPEWNPEILEKMERGEIDWTTVTSSAIAESLVRLFGESLRKTKLASISSLTTHVLEKHGFSVSVEAAEATMDALADALRRAFRSFTT
ncbi:MAG: uroporphyrinogen-III synthase [Planctomycetia bacterium]|nr:uroporphyrinogen-III synthase [Planctomycetia bacterium]